jgi:hypothetical protein
MSTATKILILAALVLLVGLGGCFLKKEKEAKKGEKAKVTAALNLPPIQS